MGPSLFDVDLTHQWELRGALPEPELPEPGVRPPNVVRLEDVEPELLDRGEFGDSSRELGAAAGSVESRAQPLGHPARQAQLPGALPRFGGGGLRRPRGRRRLHPRRRGTRCGPARWSRARRARVGHAFRAGADGMKLLAYGTREPNDIAWYPRSKKVYFRGVGLMTRLPELDYWDGEYPSQVRPARRS